MASLEQLAEDQAISPLSLPEFDPTLLAIPKEGPFIYEFDIEVRPEFELPEYKSMKLRKPVHTYTKDEVEAEKKRLLELLRPARAQGTGGHRVVRCRHLRCERCAFGGKEINKLEEVQVKVEPQLALFDGVAKDFGEKMKGRENRATCGRSISFCRKKPASSNFAEARRCKPPSPSRT